MSMRVVKGTVPAASARQYQIRNAIKLERYLHETACTSQIRTCPAVYLELRVMTSRTRRRNIGVREEDERQELVLLRNDGRAHEIGIVV